MRVMKQPTQHQTERTEMMLSSYAPMTTLKQSPQQALTERTEMMLSSYVPTTTLKQPTQQALTERKEMMLSLYLPVRALKHPTTPHWGNRSDVKCTCTDYSFETSPTITPHRENRSDAKCTRTDRSAGTWRRLCLLCASDVWSAPLSTLPGCSWRLRSSSAQRHRKTDIRTCISAFLNALNPTQNSRVVWKSRWPSWAPVPNKPTVSVDVKQHFNQLDPSMTHVWSLKCCTWIIAKVCSQFALHSSL